MKSSCTLHQYQREETGERERESCDTAVPGTIQLQVRGSGVGVRIWEQGKEEGEGRSGGFEQGLGTIE